MTLGLMVLRLSKDVYHVERRETVHILTLEDFRQ